MTKIDAGKKLFYNFVMEKETKENHTKPLRLFRIEQEIQTNTYPNVNKLAQMLGVSRRTILRNIDELKIYYHAPIEYDPQKKGYYYSESTFFVKNILFSESEISALTGILPLLERYNNTPLKDIMSRVYLSISNLIPEQIFKKQDSSEHLAFISDPVPKINSEVFNTVYKAITSHNKLNFLYKKISALEFTEYELYPYKIYNKKGDWYVLGFSPKHNKFNFYALSRIKNPVLGEIFTPEQDFEKKVNIDPEFGIWNNESPAQKIEILFDKSINTYILERTWHKNQECYQREDGSVYLSFSSNQEQEILFWLMQFGSKATVLNPPSLKEKIIDEYKKALASY